MSRTPSADNLPDFSEPRIMGILNTTPDSFSDGGKYTDLRRARDQIYLMKRDGAAIVDIGGESTRPGAEPVSEEEEIRRVIPVLESAREHFPGLCYSIDTTKYEVAKRALEAGASIINDVSGLQKEPEMAGLAAEHRAAYVIMHSKGDPKTMQKDPRYRDVVGEVYDFFERQVGVAQTAGVRNIILDPGIGFGKTVDHNLKLLAHLDKFIKIGFPVLVGASRKSMIGRILNVRPVDERLTGTIAIHYDALTKGARILRVHDVREASDSVRIFNAIQSQR